MKHFQNKNIFVYSRFSPTLPIPKKMEQKVNSRAAEIILPKAVSFFSPTLLDIIFYSIPIKTRFIPPGVAIVVAAVVSD